MFISDLKGRPKRLALSLGHSAAIVAIDHGNRIPHLVGQSIAVGMTGEPVGRKGVAQYVVRPLLAFEVKIATDKTESSLSSRLLPDFCP